MKPLSCQEQQNLQVTAVLRWVSVAAERVSGYASFSPVPKADPSAFLSQRWFDRAPTAPSPNQGHQSPQITCEAAFKYFIILRSRPNRSLLEQAASLKKKRWKQDGRRMPACSLSFHCILSKRHLEVCAYPNTYACKSKAHKHLFKAALTYRVFKLFTAAACETYQNVHIFSKILFPAPFSMI